MPNQSPIRTTIAKRYAASGRFRGGFSLVEMIVALSILVILIGMAAMYMSGGTDKARRAATDQASGMIEQARYNALVSRSTVMLAIAEPGRLPMHPDKCVLGLLRVEGDWDPTSPVPVTVKLLGRWRPLETGVIFMSGDIGGLPNPLDKDKVTIHYKTNRDIQADVHVIAFNARGRLISPDGSAPAVLRIADGGYPAGVPTPRRRGPDNRISDTWLRIGRVTGRAFEITP